MRSHEVAPHDRLLDLALALQAEADEEEAEDGEGGAEHRVRPARLVGERRDDLARAERDREARQAAAEPGEIGPLVGEVRPARGVAGLVEGHVVQGTCETGADQRRPAHPRRGAPARGRPGRRRCSPGALRVPGLVLFLASAWSLGSDGLGLDRVRRLRARAHDRHRRAGADPLRGRPDRRAAGDPPGAAAGALAGVRRHARHRGRHRPRRRLALRPRHARGPAARRDRRRHRRRGHLRAAARLDAAAQARAHARGRVGLQRPGRRPARPRLHRVDPAARTTASPTWPCCSSQQLGDRPRRSGWRSGWRGRAGVPPRRGWPSAGLYPVASLAVAALAFGARRRPPRLGLPRRLPRRADARQRRRCPARRTIVDLPRRARAGSRSSACSSRSACSSSPTELDDVARRGHGARARRSCSSRGRWRSLVATAFGPFTSRERVVLGWAGLRGAVPVVLATFPVIEGVDRAASSSSTSSSSPCSSRRCCRARRSSRSRGGSGVTTERAGAARARSARRHDPAGWAPRSWSSRSAPGDAVVGRRVRELGLPRDALRQRHRPRRAGDPAARLDARRAGRPAARARPPGGRGRVPRRRSQRWRDGPVGPPPRPPRRCAPPPAIFTSRPWREADGDAEHARGGHRHRGRRAAAHAPRPPRSARGARGRPLRGHRRDGLASARRRRCRTPRCASSSTPTKPTAHGCARSSARSRARARGARRGRHSLVTRWSRAGNGSRPPAGNGSGLVST